MNRGKWKKRIAWSIVIAILVTIASVFICDAVVTHTAKGKLYTSVGNVPANKVGLLLGTSKYLNNGVVNPYYRYRIEAAAAVMKAGKVKYLVISGDNGRAEYNEPATMREDLMQLGIDSSRIYLDYAGFRTFDSMIRLKKIFGQDSVTVISQRFHNERAVFIGSKNDIVAIGFNARDVEGKAGWRVQIREKFARVKLFLDAVSSKEPKFLGPPVKLPEW